MVVSGDCAFGNRFGSIFIKHLFLPFYVPLKCTNYYTIGTQTHYCISIPTTHSAQKDDVDASFGVSQSSATSNQGQEAFSDCVRDSSTVFPRANAPLSNPFGDPTAATACLNDTSNSAFDDSFDRGFGSIAVAPTINKLTADPFGAQATSSPSASFGSHNCSSELSGISFSAASFGSPPPPENTAAPAVTPCKPNYHAFYSVSDTMPMAPTSKDKVTDDRSGKSAAASADIFQSVAASAFQQFGNAIPSGTGFANAKKSTETSVPSAAVGVKLDLNAMATKSKEIGGGGGFFGSSSQVGVWWVFGNVASFCVFDCHLICITACMIFDNFWFEHD